MFLIFYVIRNIPEFDRYWETRLKNSNSHQSIKAVPPPKIIKISLNYFKFKMFLESCMIMIYLYDNLVYVNWLTRKNSYIFKLFFSSPIPFSGILTIKVERVLLAYDNYKISPFDCECGLRNQENSWIWLLLRNSIEKFQQSSIYKSGAAPKK